RSVLDLLLDEAARQTVSVGRVGLDLLLQMSGDEEQLRDVESLDAIHHPVHHRAPGNLEHRLGHQVRTRADPGSLPGKRNDDLHAQLLPYRSLRRTRSSSSGVDASRTSL